MSHVNATRGEWWWILINWVKVTLKCVVNQEVSLKECSTCLLKNLVGPRITLADRYENHNHFGQTPDWKIFLRNLEFSGKMRGSLKYLHRLPLYQLSLLWQLASARWCFMSITYSIKSTVLKVLITFPIHKSQYI